MTNKEAAIGVVAFAIGIAVIIASIWWVYAPCGMALIGFLIIGLVVAYFDKR